MSGTERADPAACRDCGPNRDSPNPDPDVRFLLANERTMLAWLRTGLALQAGGVGIFQFADSLDVSELLGLLLLAVGLACHLVGWQRYRSVDRAIREHQLPKYGVAPDLVVLATVLLSVVLGAVLVLSNLRGS
jgi:putative membrane protein